jgi:hypothetical protein
MSFVCYHTFYKGLDPPVPVTVGYDAPTSLAPVLAALDAPQFVHSGNWWNIDPAKRTPRAVLDGQLRFLNGHTAGFMSTNVQPGNDPKYWTKEEIDETYLETCLANAEWAKDELEASGTNVPVYCTLQPANEAAAQKWFQRAIDAGHRDLGMGVSEFLRYPAHRSEGTRRILEITHAVGGLFGEGQGRFHLSGLTSFNLIPVVAALGATSVDGSTPVQSALAYGTVFLPSGKGVQASKLGQVIATGGWSCTCPACARKSSDEVLDGFKESRTRVRHNVSIWQVLVDRINREILPDPAGWCERNQKELPTASKKYWKMASDMAGWNQ